MKNLVTGSDKFSIRLFKDGVSEILNFSYDYQALHEFDETTSIRHKFTDGDIKKKILFANLSWQIDFSEYMNEDDALLINKVKNAEFEGKQIFLTPHKDFFWREFEVCLVDPKRALSDKYMHYNYAYILDFEAIHPIKRFDWSAPNFIPAISAEIYNEF